jgi:hypothetical protein
MTNDTPPKACLADFGFTTMVFDLQNPMSSNLTLEGGTMAFTTPELLATFKFGLKNAVPAQGMDIYAFGLVKSQLQRKEFTTAQTGPSDQILRHGGISIGKAARSRR